MSCQVPAAGVAATFPRVDVRRQPGLAAPRIPPRTPAHSSADRPAGSRSCGGPLERGGVAGVRRDRLEALDREEDRDLVEVRVGALEPDRHARRSSSRGPAAGRCPTPPGRPGSTRWRSARAGSGWRPRCRSRAPARRRERGALRSEREPPHRRAGASDRLASSRERPVRRATRPPSSRRGSPRAPAGAGSRCRRASVIELPPGARQARARCASERPIRACR